MVSPGLIQNGNKPLCREMKCGMFSMADGRVMVVHDKPIKFNVAWIEYNHKNESINLIGDDGTQQDMGLELDDATKRNLLNGQNVTFTHIANSKLLSSRKIALIVQDY